MLQETKQQERVKIENKTKIQQVSTCPRLAEELAKHGHRVRHLLSDGSEEPHETGAGMPDFLVQEPQIPRTTRDFPQGLWSHGVLATWTFRPQKQNRNKTKQSKAEQKRNKSASSELQKANRKRTRILKPMLVLSRFARRRPGSARSRREMGKEEGHKGALFDAPPTLDTSP